MNYLFCLNGAPRSGKDTVGSIIKTIMESHPRSTPVDMLKLAEPLKEAVHAMHGKFVPAAHFEDTKDQPSEIFFGKTPRQAYIHFSEQIVKPNFSPAWWANVLVNKILQDQHRALGEDTCTAVSDLVAGSTYTGVITDVGFDVELSTLFISLVKSLPPAQRFTLVLVHIDRPGTSFSDDSRGQVFWKLSSLELSEFTPWIKTVKVTNDGDFDQLKQQVKNMIYDV